MTKRGLIILVVAVLAVGFGAAAIASSMGGSDDSSQPAGQHQMQNGQMMEDSEMGSGSGMPTTKHQMPNGQTMQGSGGSGTGSMGGDGMDMNP